MTLHFIAALDPTIFEAIKADPLYAVLLFFVCFGAMCTMGLTVMIPLTADILIGVFGAVFGERFGAQARGQTSGTITPEILDRDFVDPGPDVKPIGG